MPPLDAEGQLDLAPDEWLAVRAAQRRRRSALIGAAQSLATMLEMREHPSLRDGAVLAPHFQGLLRDAETVLCARSREWDQVQAVLMAAQHRRTGPATESERLEGRPYRCGAFNTGTREVCLLNSDHGPPHIMLADLQ